MPDPTTTRWRLIRGTAFAVLAGQLAALGHLLGGGALPDPAVLITVTVFLGGAASSLARRRRTGPQILGLLAASQIVFHAVFLLTAGHAGHAGQPAVAGSVGTAQMIAFHLIAALATSWLLTRGEDTVFRLFAALRRVLTRFPRTLVVPSLPGWTVSVGDGSGAVRLRAGELSLISRRGPPGCG